MSNRRRNRNRSHKKTHLVFAFGSNLDPVQMQRRCPSARPVCRATLPDHRLDFAGYSRGWGGSVATVIPHRKRRTAGVVYRLSTQDLLTLDKYEGAPRVYRRELLTVDTENGQTVTAWTYIHNSPERRGEPSIEYLLAILTGCEEHRVNSDAIFRRLERQLGEES